MEHRIRFVLRVKSSEQMESACDGGCGFGWGMCWCVKYAATVPHNEGLWVTQVLVAQGIGSLEW
jgi:hypothetical protein